MYAKRIQGKFYRHPDIYLKVFSNDCSKDKIFSFEHI